MYVTCYPFPIAYINEVQDDMVFGNATLMPEVGFNGLPQDELDYYMSLVSYSALNAFTEPNTFEPWNNGVPAAYIYTTLDNALPYASQQAMVSFLASTNYTEYTLDLGHCGFLVEPETVLAVWKEIVDLAVSYE